jgi:putative SOS response-associated peptidase YedK
VLAKGAALGTGLRLTLTVSRAEGGGDDRPGEKPLLGGQYPHDDAKAAERSLDVLRWSLLPYWAKDLKVGFANINAKAEGIENRPPFREVFQRRRCLVPVDNFYEWKKTATGKQPYAMR